MANLVKVKRASALFSVGILVATIVLRNNFYSEITINKWQDLTWDHFNGIPTLFTGWGAVISSTVYLEYDSASMKYSAYSGQNDQKSWVKSNTKNSDYALNHEQYHFNITEYHARKLNDVLSKEKLVYESLANLKLNSIRSELTRMQDNYDNQSDHSLKRDFQNRWEYRIDSLLKISEGDTLVTDYLTGATAFFPVTPRFFTGSDSNSAHRVFELVKYNMTFGLASFQYEDLNLFQFKTNLKSYYDEDSIFIKKFRFDSVGLSNIKCHVESYDSLSNEYFYQLWHYNGHFLFKVTASYLIKSADTLGYVEMARSFINSFQVAETRNYWIEQLSKSNTKYQVNSIVTDKSRSAEITKCAVHFRDKLHGTFGYPIFLDDGAFLMVYSLSSHPIDSVQEVALIHDDQWYSYEPDSIYQILYVPADQITTSDFVIQFGHMLKKSKSKKCYDFYSHEFVVRSEINLLGKID